MLSLLSLNRRRSILLGVISVTSLLALASPGQAQIWEFDRMDNLASGNLSGQNGWSGLPGPQVILLSGGNKILQLNGFGVQVSSGKAVVQQALGLQVLELTVRVTNAAAATASEAKLEIHANPAELGWNKKLQLFFGSSMRVNYHPNGAFQTIVPATQEGRFYTIRVDINMAGNFAAVYVDGLITAANFPVQSGPITGLSVTGFVSGTPARVQIDNLLGFRLF